MLMAPRGIGHRGHREHRTIEPVITDPMTPMTPMPDGIGDAELVVDEEEAWTL